MSESDVIFTKRYPVLYYCDFCGNSGYTKKDGHPKGNGTYRCPTCNFGTLLRMHWNGIAWH